MAVKPAECPLEHIERRGVTLGTGRGLPAQPLFWDRNLRAIAAAADEVMTLVDEDPGDPRRKPFGFAKARDLSPGDRECVLESITRVRLVADDRRSKAAKRGNSGWTSSSKAVPSPPFARATNSGRPVLRDSMYLHECSMGVVGSTDDGISPTTDTSAIERILVEGLRASCRGRPR